MQSIESLYRVVKNTANPRGHSHIKRRGCSSETLKEPLRGTKVQFYGRGLKFFERVTIGLFFLLLKG